MKNRIPIVLALIATVALGSCEGIGNQTIIGTGPVESMEVDLPAFQGINVVGTCNVEIVIGEPQSVEFYAQGEVLDVLTHKVDDNMLEIGFRRGYTVNTSEEIRAEITIPELQFVGITGAGDYELSGVQQERLDIHVTGVGNVDAYDMPVNTCNIRISGTSNCQVHASERLDVVISGVANIWYRGDPAIHSDISGVGNLFPEAE